VQCRLPRRPCERDGTMASVCLPSVCLSFFLLFCLLICLPACLSVCLSVCLSACLSVCLSVYMLVCLSVCLPARILVCVSVCFFAFCSVVLGWRHPIFMQLCPGHYGFYNRECVPYRGHAASGPHAISSDSLPSIFYVPSPFSLSPH
jgi:hypothetical protein